VNTTIYTEKYSLGEILRQSWRYFCSNFWLILAVTLIVYLPTYLFEGFILYGAWAKWFGSRFNLFWEIIRFLLIFIRFIASIAVIYIIETAVLGKSITLRGTMQFSLSRWGAYIGTFILYSIFLGGLLLLFIIPGIIFFVYWIFAFNVVVLRGLIGKAALDYSRDIVRGRWKKIFGIFLLTILMGLSISIPIHFILQSESHYGISYRMLWVFLNTLENCCFAFFTVVETILFLNLDYRKNHIFPKNPH